jgi:hypothetical protein
VTGRIAARRSPVASAATISAKTTAMPISTTFSEVAAPSRVSVARTRSSFRSSCSASSETRTASKYDVPCATVSPSACWPVVEICAIVGWA